MLPKGGYSVSYMNSWSYWTWKIMTSLGLVGSSACAHMHTLRCVWVLADHKFQEELTVYLCKCSGSPCGARGLLLIRCLCILTRWYISSQQHSSLSLHACWENKPDLCKTPTTTLWSDWEVITHDFNVAGVHFIVHMHGNAAECCRDAQ